MSQQDTAVATQKHIVVSEPELQLDRTPAFYEPGDAVRAELLLPGSIAGSLRSIELSLVWFTVGKGDEDLYVSQFQRHQISPAKGKPGVSPWLLEANLPASPLSYNGRAVKVCWAVRARLFDKSGKVSLIEQPLRLGEVAQAPVVESDQQVSGTSGGHA